MTRARARVTKPNQKYFSFDYVLMVDNISTQSKKIDSIPIEPKTVQSALKD